MDDEKPTANDKDIDEFLKEFEPLFNTYINAVKLFHKSDSGKKSKKRSKKKRRSRKI